ncbi:hypothetical protein [Prosthecobacter sp.]|uniref:hypothetical protein n=1 Tax=Prosthecobacter sp. TaxID=1965333 RepID=UPI003783D2C4
MPSTHHSRPACPTSASRTHSEPRLQLASIPRNRAQSSTQDRTLRAIHHAIHRSTPTHDPRTHLHLAHHALTTTFATTSSSHQQELHLIHWAKENHLHIPHDQFPAACQPPSHLEDSFMEHHVWPHHSGHRILKLTHAGHFGLWPSAHKNGAGWDLHTRHTTPLRYLTRLLAANTHLGDDFVLHAIITDSHCRPQILTSQPHYPGPTPGDIIDAAPPSQQSRIRHQQHTLIRQALAARGFHPTHHSPSTFYRPADNLALFDAHFQNLIWHPSPHSPRTLIPFDVLPLHPHGKLRENLSLSLLPIPSPLSKTHLPLLTSSLIP